MATFMMLQARRTCAVGGYFCMVARQYCFSRPSTIDKFLHYLNKKFLEVEYLTRWSNWFSKRVVRRKNKFYDYTHERFGANVAAAYYILKLGGSFRFAGQEEWFRTDIKGKFNSDFANTPDLTIEEIDLSRTLVNSAGLDNLVSQRMLRSISLHGCPEVDNWFLARLHIFGNSLQELNISHCPGITVGGLAALQHLRKLQWLDMSSLPQLHSPGLVRILVEEMLPQCKVTGIEYDQGIYMDAAVTRR